MTEEKNFEENDTERVSNDELVMTARLRLANKSLGSNKLRYSLNLITTRDMAQNLFDIS